MTDHPMIERVPHAPAGSSRRPRGLVRRLYTSNPFYILSADLVFVGLRMSFNTYGHGFETWALMLGLAGYTLLLATTACFLIRLGGVWDDVRSVLLLVVLMFLAMSVTFDDTLAGNPGLGVAYYVGGLLFAAAVSEGVLRGIRLVLPAGFRVPYYLILALFFLYPVGLVPVLNHPDSPALQWALFGFATLAGLAFLTLLPAIRKGPAYVAANGSPWGWPLYPWVLFGLLGVAVCARAYYLCISLHFVERSTLNASRSTSIFGLYFLVPFFLALGLLLLELGVVARSRAVLRTALAFPLGMLALCLAGEASDVVSQRFLAIFMGALGGSPLYLTLIVTVVFYAFASLRRVPWACEALSLSLAALAVIGPATQDLDGTIAPRAWPMVAAALPQLWLAFRRRESTRALLGAGCLVAAVAIGLPQDWSITARGVSAYHLAMLAALVLGALFDDPLGMWLRRAGAALMIAACIAGVVAGADLLPGVAPEVIHGHSLALAVVALSYGALVGDRLYHATALAALTTWLCVTSWRGYLLLRQAVVGLDLIAWGLASFVLAALISLKKAGVFSKRLMWRSPENEL